MPGNPWTSHADSNLEHLRVPSHAQPTDEAECVVYSLWMVSNYVGNEFPDAKVREETNVPTIGDIHEYIQPDPKTGWKPNQDDLTELSAYVSSLHFSLEQRSGNPPRELSELAEESLENDLPLIAVIDALQLRRGIRRSGPLHTVVIAGVDDDEIAFADPWYAKMDNAPKENLEDAWDPMLQQTIDVSLSGNVDSQEEEQ